MTNRANEILIRLLPPALRRKYEAARSTATDEFLATFSKRDPEENAETTPPEDEYIDLSCLWGMEFYTPVHFQRLIASFERLDWHAGKNYDPTRNPRSWLHGLRRHQYGGAWMNLGFLVHKDSDALLIGANKHIAPLPAWASYAHAGIYSVSPSLISITIKFVLDDNASTRLDCAIRTNRRTFTTPKRNGRQIHTPEFQKTDHIKQIRADLSQEIAIWFSNNLPGLFSSGILDHDIPTCEFVTLRKAEPFRSHIDTETGPQRYLDVLGLRRNFDAWQSSETPGLKFRMPDTADRPGRYHAILAINEDQHKEAMPRVYGGHSRDARIGHVGQLMPNLLALWAILPMLEGYTQRLHKIRDSASFRPNSRMRPAKILDTLGNNVADSVDIAAVISELAMHSQERFPLIHSVEQFKPCDNKVYKTDNDLRSHLEWIVEKRVGWLTEVDRSIRSHLTQYGSLVGAVENVRLQRTIARLTWSLVALALVTSGIAVIPFICRTT